ncbi:sulfurtransferase TusA family protein [Aquibium sp. A9E412]|uniref:sulfurtransferase TusA family protein n=1 Tax=Aquibium sp. A9E412 TaxID=2976767 RepID=UPI0025B01459|nr:sulfurtransferase TusA family protein [Aquibium sp. A9E412]MDN2567643.1 sulfurtransferase TusA family protein [Aquibium sp. A9E412]
MPERAERPAGDAPAEIYDLKGLRCPLPVLRARKRLAGMAPGARLWLETTDPLAGIDIPAFCNDSGHRLIDSQTVAGGHRFLIERG